MATMKGIDCGDVMIRVSPEVFADLIACARIGAEGADDALGEARADAVWALLDQVENAVVE